MMRKGVVDREGNIINVIQANSDSVDWNSLPLTDLPCEKGDRLVNGEIVKGTAPVRSVTESAVLAEMWRRIASHLGVTVENVRDAVLINGSDDEVKRLYMKAREIAAFNPVPQDYRDDKHWPVVLSPRGE